MHRGEESLTAHVPGCLTAAEGGANLLDLEPVRGAISSGSIVDLGHVERDGALVVHSLVGGERDGGACGDRDGGGSAARATSDVAAKVVVGQDCDGAVVVCVLPDVLVLGALLAVGGEVLEDVCKSISGCAYNTGKEPYSGHAQPQRGWRAGMRRQ